MAVKRVYGTVDGAEVILDSMGGNRWSVPVPLDGDGKYVVEMIAEDEAGNLAFMARLLYTVDAGNICIHLLPLPSYRFERLAGGFQFDRLYPACRGVGL